MDNLLKEARMLLALKALRNGEKLSILAATNIYNIAETILRSRRDGRPVRCDILANLRKLTDLEEKTIV